MSFDCYDEGMENLALNGGANRLNIKWIFEHYKAEQSN